jgi:hypothetical protein
MKLQTIATAILLEFAWSEHYSTLSRAAFLSWLVDVSIRQCVADRLYFAKRGYVLRG